MFVTGGPPRRVHGMQLAGYWINLSVQPDPEEVVDVPADAVADVVLHQDAAALKAGGVILAYGVAAERKRPGVDHAVRAHAPPELVLRRADRRLEPDQPEDGGELDVAEIILEAQVRGKVRHALDVRAQPVGGDIGEWLLDARRPIELVGQGDGHSGLRNPEADDAARPTEVHGARPRVTVLEHRVLLAEP